MATPSKPASDTRNGYLITLEGGEGTGKSTLMVGLADALRERGLPVTTTREPGGSTLAEMLRTATLDPPQGHAWSPLAHALLMNAARDDHLRTTIRPALQRGMWVLCDRFIDSTQVYQGVDGVAKPLLEQLERAVVGDGKPDLTIILDASPKTLARRRHGRDKNDVFEIRTMPFHEKIRSAFLDIAAAESSRCRIVNALQPADAVLKDSLCIIDSSLGLT